MDKVARLNASVDALEAERVVETLQLRNDLVKACRQLLPLALAEAKPGPACKECGRTAQKGSPALLRLISRTAMRDVSIDRKKR